MRAIVLDGVVRIDLMLWGLGLNVVYFALGVTAFMLALRSARQRAKLMQVGE
jgi:hypothetical protein